MKTLMSLALVAFIAMIISFAIPSKSDAKPCNRFLDVGMWDCFLDGGNCCDDVVIYG